MSVTTEDKHELTERGDMRVLTDLHHEDLRELRDVHLTVSTDPAAWRTAHQGDGYQPLPEEEVRLHIGRWGTHLYVEGDNRDHVRGLAVRLQTEVDRGAGSRWAQLGFILTLNVLINAVVIGLQSAFGDLHGAAVWGVVAGVALLSGLTWAAAMFWLFPTIELRPDGRVSRWVRARRWTLSAVGALVIAIVGSFVYGAIPHH